MPRLQAQKKWYSRKKHGIDNLVEQESLEIVVICNSGEFECQKCPHALMGSSHDGSAKGYQTPQDMMFALGKHGEAESLQRMPKKVVRRALSQRHLRR